jgi:hypothetical protein
MTSTPRIIGNHVFFFREGGTITVPATDCVAGLCTRTNKPAATDPLYVELAKVDKLVGKHQKDEKIIFAPNPCRLEPVDVLINKRQISIEFDSQELSVLSFELLFGFNPVNMAANGSGQYDPNSEGAVKGWLHVEQFGPDSDTVPVNSVDLFVYLSLSGDITFDDNVIKTTMSALKLTSTQNVGKLIMP